MKLIYLFSLTLFIITPSFSQQKDTLSIKGKFDLIYNTSSTYKEYKIIRKSRLNNLRNKVSDSIKQLNNDLNLKGQRINKLEQDLNNINKVLLKNIAEKTTDISLKNSIFFFGIELKKSSYKFMVWIIFILLVGVLSYFIFKYKNSFLTILEAKENLLQAEEELVMFKKKSIESDQKLRRQLQDEINKQRGV
jgi:transcriptional regulator with XRE-family HTH domain